MGGSVPKVVVLILSTQRDDYKCFVSNIRNTWAKDLKSNNISCYFYEGGWDKNSLEGDTIRLNVDDSLSNTYDKFIACASYLSMLSIDYDVLFRTNLSSYIDVPIFINFLNQSGISQKSYEGVGGITHLPRERLYAKSPTSYFTRIVSLASSLCVGFFDIGFGERIEFRSGAGLFLGSDVVAYLIEYNDYKRHVMLIDDVKIGWILKNKFNSVLNVRRFDVLESDAHKITRSEYYEMVSLGLFHYKFKNKNRAYDCNKISEMHDHSIRTLICTKET